jgi:phosphatidylglycerol:prolipoprotein diacylglycerol transferase
VFRWVLEFFRQPDAQLGFILSFLTMGQLLCSAMIVAGSLLLAYRLKIAKRGWA